MTTNKQHTSDDTCITLIESGTLSGPQMIKVAIARCSEQVWKVVAQQVDLSSITIDEMAWITHGTGGQKEAYIRVIHHIEWQKYPSKKVIEIAQKLDRCNDLEFIIAQVIQTRKLSDMQMIDLVNTLGRVCAWLYGYRETMVHTINWTMYSPEQMIDIGFRADCEEVWKKVLESIQAPYKQVNEIAKKATNNKAVWRAAAHSAKLHFADLLEIADKFCDRICDHNYEKTKVCSDITRTRKLSPTEIVILSRECDCPEVVMVAAVGTKALSVRQMFELGKVARHKDVWEAIVKTEKLSKKQLLEIGSNLKGDDWYCWRLIILTKKLNVKEILAVHKRVGNKIASTVIGATFRTGGITVSQAFAIARSSGEESQHCYSTLARVLTETNRWADISIRQALEIGRRSWGEWLLVGEHIDWSQLNAEQVIEIGRACSKPHIWEKVAQYMEWSTLGTERVLDVCIEANHTAVWIAATKYLTSASMSE